MYEARFNNASRDYLTRTLSITIGVTGTSFIPSCVAVCAASIFFTTSIPLVTLPTTAYDRYNLKASAFSTNICESPGTCSPVEATPTILPDSLPATVRGDLPRTSSAPEALPASGFDLEAHVKQIERGYIAEALKRAGGVQVKAADLTALAMSSSGPFRLC